MIVLPDTSVLHRDVHAKRWALSAILEAAAEGDFEMVIPEVVVVEAVRQYEERLPKAVKEMIGAIKKWKPELDALGLSVPEVSQPEVAESISQYELQLRDRLSKRGCRIAETPDMRPAVKWAAERRKPFREDGSGLPDAAVWLTALDQAGEDEVVLITANTTDFADPSDESRPAPELRADLKERGLSDDRIRIVSTALAFAAAHVDPVRRDTAYVRSQLTAAEWLKLEQATIDGVPWFSPVNGEEDWQLGVELEEPPTVAAFDPDEFQLRAAVKRPDGGFDLEVIAIGSLTLDLFLEKGEALHVPDDSPVTIWDWDWNERYTAASAEVDARLVLDVRYQPPDDFAVSVDSIEPI